MKVDNGGPWGLPRKLPGRGFTPEPTEWCAASIVHAKGNEVPLAYLAWWMSITNQWCGKNLCYTCTKENAEHLQFQLRLMGYLEEGKPKVWLATGRTKAKMNVEMYQEWLSSDAGQEWLTKPAGQKWLRSPGGQQWRGQGGQWPPPWPDVKANHKKGEVA